MSPRHHAVPAARTTLQRVRLISTIVFTVTNAAGLLLFAWLAIRFDARNGVQRLDTALQVARRAAVDRIDLLGPPASVGSDTVRLNGLDRVRLEKDACVAVLPGLAQSQFLGRELDGGDHCELPLSVANELAALATQRADGVTTSVQVGGRTVRVLAEPFGAPSDGQSVNTIAAAGAVVATVDAQPAIDQHRGMALATSIGCAVVIIGVGLFGHLMAVRATRPAVDALDQQELFLAESAHDLRTPVAALRAITETAMDHADQRGVLLPRAVALTHRMSDIIDDLLIRARLAAGVEQLNLQPVRLDQLVAGVVDDLPESDEGDVYLTGVASTVAADYPLLRRAINNLVVNARKYGHRPGERALVEVDVREGRVIVADHGPGMHAPMADKPFARRDRSSPESTGLGLPIVRWVADAHGGTLRVHNAPDGGAVFVLQLPPMTP